MFSILFPLPFLASGSDLLRPHANPSVCVQDGTLRLWEYRSGRQLQCCDLASLQEPGEHPGHKVASCPSWVPECLPAPPIEMFPCCKCVASFSLGDTHRIPSCVVPDGKQFTLHLMCTQGLPYRKATGHTWILKDDDSRQPHHVLSVLGARQHSLCSQSSPWHLLCTHDSSGIRDVPRLLSLKLGGMVPALPQASQ